LFFWGLETPKYGLIEVKFGTMEVPFVVPNFTIIRGMSRPCGARNPKFATSKFNTSADAADTKTLFAKPQMCYDACHVTLVHLMHYAVRIDVLKICQNIHQ